MERKWAVADYSIVVKQRFCYTSIFAFPFTMRDHHSFGTVRLIHSNPCACRGLALSLMQCRWNINVSLIWLCALGKCFQFIAIFRYGQFHCCKCSAHVSELNLQLIMSSYWWIEANWEELVGWQTVCTLSSSIACTRKTQRRNWQFAHAWRLCEWVRRLRSACSLYPYTSYHTHSSRHSLHSCVKHSISQKMSSNSVTDDQPVESIKNFRFESKDKKEVIEIAIPEVSHRPCCLG